jgi:hypothetical protein
MKLFRFGSSSRQFLLDVDVIIYRQLNFLLDSARDFLIVVQCLNCYPILGR